MHKIKKLIMVQLVLTLFLALMFAISGGVTALWSAILGGICCMVPNMYFAAKLFKHHGASMAKKIVGGFYLGEAVKILLSMLMFALVFIYVPISPRAFFITFIAVQMTIWFAPWLIS